MSRRDAILAEQREDIIAAHRRLIDAVHTGSGKEVTRAASAVLDLVDQTLEVPSYGTSTETP